MTNPNPTVGGDTDIWGPKLNAVLDELRPGATRGAASVAVASGAPFQIFCQTSDPAAQANDGDWWVRIP